MTHEPFDLTQDIPLSTGLADMDALTGGGLMSGTLTVIAGYPGLGSSTLALDLVRAAAIHDRNDAYLCALESTRPQMERRIMAAEAPASLFHLTSGTLREQDAPHIAQARQRLADAPLCLTDRHRDLDTIANHARKHVPQLRMIAIDGAHLLVPAHDYGGRAQSADDFARDLKELAVELDLTVVVTVALEFPFGGRTDPRPLLRDFGKRQSFAATADIVILVHREDYYERESPRAGEADLIVAKHRNGPTATVLAAFQEHYSRFVDMYRS